MLGYRLALTAVKAKKTKAEGAPAETMNLEQIGEVVVDTAAGVGTVVVVVATTLTVLRVTEHVVKCIFR